MTVPGCAVLKGADRFELAEQVRISPIPKLCGASTHYVRCLSNQGRRTVLTDVDQASRVVERRTEDLPTMHRLWFHGSGYGLGYRKLARIGYPSELFFLDANGRLQRSAQLPDAVSEVAPGPGAWYVGCRDSALYAFALEGTRLWRRRIEIPAEYFIPGIASWATAPCLHVGA